ncbi:MAG: hypothetical protein OJF62_003568 [Pseudolabrys sp.]|jgi:hypothetical protein|nr:hypothetical protein [Pseudolabrys sp.]
MPQKTDESVESVADSITLSRFDGRGLIRVLLWGATAAAAVTLVMTTATSNVGAARLKQAIASIVEPPKATPAPQPAVTPQQLAKVEDETHALLKAVRDLSVERDQMKTRLASIEQSLTDITGAIRRQSAQAAKAESPKLATAVSAAPETTASISSPSGPAPEPAVAAPALAAPASVPLPPARLAHAASPSPHDAALRQIGIDIAGASSIEELRARWASIKANIGPDIAGLRPSYVVKRRPNGVAEYRLVLAPLPNTSAALRLCVRLNAAKVFCRAGYFNGEQMAEQ